MAAFSCASAVAAPALLADFSDWDPVAGNWGSTAGVYGSLFAYNSDGPPKSTLAVAVDGANPALHITGSVSPAMTNGGYAGAGLAFKVCASAAV